MVFSRTRCLGSLGLLGAGSHLLPGLLQGQTRRGTGQVVRLLTLQVQDIQAATRNLRGASLPGETRNPPAPRYDLSPQRVEPSVLLGEQTHPVTWEPSFWGLQSWRFKAIPGRGLAGREEEGASLRPGAEESVTRPHQTLQNGSVCFEG